MFGKAIAACAAGLLAIGLSTVTADAMVSLPKRLHIPESTEMKLGKYTLAPFGHVKFCRFHPSQCRVKGGEKSVAMTLRKWRQLNRVNSLVNRAIRPLHDIRVAGSSDQWSLGPRAGDCEDYALTKRAQLLRAGWPSSSLLIATAHVPNVGYHAVLVVRTDKGDFVLDNLLGQVKPWRKTGYRWSKMQSPSNPKFWVNI